MDPTPAAAPSSDPSPPRPRAYREVTLSAIIFGVVVGAIMNAAITYAGLKIGFTIGGSAIAAVLGFGVLRGLLRKGSILETNIAQTIASAVNVPNSGVIFTVPVLLLLGFRLSLGGTDFWLITVAAVAGSILGVAFIIPLRKQMLDVERLRFPSAVAVATILKSPGAGPRKSLVLVAGIVLAAILAAPAQLPQIKAPADPADLDELVLSGRIERADLLRTRLISGWIEARQAPAEVVEHGRLLFELVEAKEANAPEVRAGLGPDERRARADRVAALEAAVANAAERGRAALQLAVDDPSDRARLAGGYPDELARRVYLASTGEADWGSLRDTEAGWAADPLPGYADLGWRLSAREEPNAAPVDYGYDGLGEPDPVLAVEVDRDRDGRPDLIMTDETIDVGRWLGLPDQMQLIFAIAPFALGAGYLTGRAGLFVLAGGILAYLIINPVLYAAGWMPETTLAHEAPGFGFAKINRPLGIGLLLGGALMGVLASLPAIREAFRSIFAAGVRPGAARDELGGKTLVAAAAAAAVLLFLAADLVSSKPINVADPVTGESIESAEHIAEYNGYAIAFASEESLAAFQGASDEQKLAVAKPLSADKPGLLTGLSPHVRSALIALVGGLWIWFAGIIIAQCTGMTDWSPISGMALLTVVLILLLAGPGEVIGAVLIGVALCVAITCAADMMADLKTGYLVGGSPRRQQVVEIVTTGIGPVISMVVLLVIVEANLRQYGVPIGAPSTTIAPQAQALQAIITGVQGGEMPYALYGLGAVLGALLGLGAFSGLGVLVGLSMYLPMIYISTYGIGCLVNMAVRRVKGAAWSEEWGVPLAAGLIVGDALLALGVNIYILLPWT